MFNHIFLIFGLQSITFYFFLQVLVIIVFLNKSKYKFNDMTWTTKWLDRQHCATPNEADYNWYKPLIGTWLLGPLVIMVEKHSSGCRYLVLITFGMTFGFTLYSYTYTDHVKTLTQSYMNYIDTYTKHKDPVEEESYNVDQAVQVMGNDELDILKNSSRNRAYPIPFNNQTGYVWNYFPC